MKVFLQRLLKFLAYTAAAVVILLAIGVGLFRLFLPRLPEYQEEIKLWASTAIGMRVEFSSMDARWGLQGPELAFHDTELLQAGGPLRIVAADEVRVGIALNRLLFDNALVVDRVVIRDTSVEIRQLDSGEFLVQGQRPADLVPPRRGTRQRTADMEIVGENLEIVFIQPGDERPRFLDIRRAASRIDGPRVTFDAVARLPDDLGRQLRVSATRMLDADRGNRWDIDVEGSALKLDGWSALLPSARHRILSGEGDADLSIGWENGRIGRATAEVDFTSVSLAEGKVFDIVGLFEFDTTEDSWLFATEEFQLAVGDHAWPESSLRAEASVDDDGKVAMIDVRASYLDLDDVGLFESWLPENAREQLAAAAPSGIVRDLTATISDIDASAPRYDVSAEFENAGIAAQGSRPGVRGFSGQVNANRSGGRLEIQSENLFLELPRFMEDPIDIESASGTVLWRSSNGRTTVISDSVRIRNEIFDSRSNVQITLGQGETAPEIDLVTTFSIDDISAARRYVPRRIMKQRLYDWFQLSLQGGALPRGTLRLNGPLDKFPFDGGEGRLLVEGSLRDLVLKYQPRWPAAEQADVEMVLDNMRLYTVRNRAVHAGNEAVDVNLEIADLRRPVLNIEGLVTGSLASIREFGLQSPINEVLGNNLDRITVDGDASFSLDLSVPLKDAKNFEIHGVLRSNNGTLSVQGLAPPVTDIIGEVTITRDAVTSDSLGARFLGEPISIQIVPTDDPRLTAVANVSGNVGAEALITDMGIPLEGLMQGRTAYTGRLLFPRGRLEEPLPFTIEIQSGLDGMQFDLPEPLRKAAETPWQISGDIRFMPGGEAIESAGFLGDEIAWKVGFAREDDVWDLDRGVIDIGTGVVEPAATRGLHIRGMADTLRLEEWLDLSRSGEKKTGAAGRIRSIDLVIDHFYALGQHLQKHRVRVDRSALDWLVQIEGDDVTGSVFVPYDFDSDRELVVEMERLRLPGDEAAEPSSTSPDPRRIPPIRLTAGEFAIGDRYLGAVEARLERRENGLEATTLTARDDTFDVVGTGRWIADENDPMGSRTELVATLTSRDAEATLVRLDFGPGIQSEEMRIDMDLSWSGGPRADLLETLDGNVRVSLADGQLEEVEPGAGRVFGLMSFAALPRRLSLDFTDVFNKGFGFDEVTGTFRIEDGVAHTCDLSLEGPAADIGMVGRTDLAGRRYEQGAVVSANLGNTLPIVGAVVGGPPGAAAMLIFSQLFRKPLQEMGQVYYAMEGPWEDPMIESAGSDDFVRYGELAGCLAERQ